MKCDALPLLVVPFLFFCFSCFLRFLLPDLTLTSPAYASLYFCAVSAAYPTPPRTAPPPSSLVNSASSSGSTPSASRPPAFSLSTPPPFHARRGTGSDSSSSNSRNGVGGGGAVSPRDGSAASEDSVMINGQQNAIHPLPSPTSSSASAKSASGNARTRATHGPTSPTSAAGASMIASSPDPSPPLPAVARDRTPLPLVECLSDSIFPFSCFLVSLIQSTNIISSSMCFHFLSFVIAPSQVLIPWCCCQVCISLSCHSTFKSRHQFLFFTSFSSTLFCFFIIDFCVWFSFCFCLFFI